MRNVGMFGLVWSSLAWSRLSNTTTWHKTDRTRVPPRHVNHLNVISVAYPEAFIPPPQLLVPLRVSFSDLFFFSLSLARARARAVLRCAAVA